MTICPEGTRGYVVGSGCRVEAEVVEVSAASVYVRWTPPSGNEQIQWFSTSPGARYLRRHGDTSEQALRFEPAQETE